MWFDIWKNGMYKVTINNLPGMVSTNYFSSLREAVLFFNKNKYYRGWKVSLYGCTGKKLMEAWN